MYTYDTILVTKLSIHPNLSHADNFILDSVSILSFRTNFFMDLLATYPTDVIVLASWPRDIRKWSIPMSYWPVTLTSPLKDI